MNYTFQLGVALDRLPELLDGALAHAAARLPGLLGRGADRRVRRHRQDLRRPGARGLSPALCHLLHQHAGAAADLLLLFRPARGRHPAVARSCACCSASRSTPAPISPRSCAPASSRCAAPSSRPRRRWASRLAQQVRWVILPHVAKTIYPALANFFIILVLGTSMAAVFGVDELTGTAINISTENYRWIEMFTVVAAHLHRAHLHREPARWPRSGAGAFASRPRCSDAGAPGRGDPALLQLLHDPVPAAGAWARRC